MPFNSFFILQLCFIVSPLSLDCDCLFFQGTFKDHKCHRCSFPSETSSWITARLKLCYSKKKTPRSSCHSFMISKEWRIINSKHCNGSFNWNDTAAHAMMFSCWIIKSFDISILIFAIFIWSFISYCITAIRTSRSILILILLLIICFQTAVQGRIQLLRCCLIYDMYCIISLLIKKCFLFFVYSEM